MDPWGIVSISFYLVLRWLSHNVGAVQFGVGASPNLVQCLTQRDHRAFFRTILQILQASLYNLKFRHCTVETILLRIIPQKSPAVIFSLNPRP